MARAPKGSNKLDCELDTVAARSIDTQVDDSSDSAPQTPTKGSAPTQEGGQSNPLLRSASKLLQRARSHPAAQKISQTFAGSRFNDHIRRVRRFSRRAAVYSWIEPSAIIISALCHFLLHQADILTNWFFLFLSTVVFGEVLMVIFSIFILMWQALKSQREESQTISNIRTKAATDSPTADPTTPQVATAVEETKAPRSRCQSMRPPQVVRWDIVGVTLSNWFGKINSIPLPTFCRAPMYKAYSWYFGVNLDEIKLPLKNFHCMQDFFTRELKAGVRPIAKSPIVSPVDAKLVVSGRVTSDRVEQVKGVTYPIPSFLGEDTWEKIKDKNIYQCVLYLAPGDYHRIHSGTSWELNTLRHFPGTLFPISPIVARLVPNLFALNERVVLAGQWEHGFFSSTAVGAYHVGSMAFNFDQNIRTNKIRRDFTNPNLAYLTTRELGAHAYHFDYPEGQLKFGPGDEIGTFKLGSTIVLFFEVPADKKFVFDIPCGSKVKMGQALGHIE